MDKKPVNSSEEKVVESKGINAFVLIFVVIIIAAILTYIMPAGTYERSEIDGRTVVDPTSFTFTESSPVSFMGIFNSVHLGMIEGAGIIFFVFMVGGAFGILKATGALDALVTFLTIKLANKAGLLIPILMLFFAAAGTLMGMAEETLVYIGILVPLAIALRFDAITGFAIVSLGASVGFSAAVMNPFTVGVAQGIAELPTFSGIGLRLALLATLYITAVWYVWRYAKKVRNNPSIGFYGSHDSNTKVEMDSTYKMQTHHKFVLIVFLINFIVLIFGVLNYGWYITEIAGLFLLFGILIGFIGKLSPSEIADSFIEGAKLLVPGALVIGFAQAILVIFQSGMLMDTILYYASGVLENLPAALSAIGMFIFQLFFNFLIPSGSGQAALTMPIMAPLGDLIGVTRQTTVLAYQLGDGISNILFPTVGFFMAGLALAGIPWGKWIKWVFPFALMQVGIAIVFLLIAHFIQYGPF
ncbi:AbgT family transporter [Microbacterium sp. APC 3898]|uniref:AbgT family transporter n=1 Tax=Planococcus notacanthi TaxID=3035188 RepID=A0ABT7ZH57_9BACL|nr:MULTISPECIES: AbgT family transporter [Terrabacteria group]MDN3426459.1 AbgT family transporter [Planococcus sp. APC 4016]MDN3498154.1 AbgT family transporter [Microbacterium sp. APC 3898]